MTTQTPDPQLDERMALEERFAILKAVKCPGKTHTMIKNKALRAEFARELNDWRKQRHLAVKQFGNWFPPDISAAMRGGLESGFWAMQKSENKAFLYQDQRVTWQLSAEIDTRTAEEQERYTQYEVAVVAFHKKVLNILAEIEADFQKGRLDETQRARARRAIKEKEDVKINALQREYHI